MFYLPKFFDLCLDEVQTVRDSTALIATAPILKNFVKSGSQNYSEALVKEMKFFRGSKSFKHR